MDKYNAIQYYVLVAFAPTTTLYAHIIAHCHLTSYSQPFPTRGPLDKFCLGSRSTQNISTFFGKISEYLTTFLKLFSLNFVSVRRPPKRISPIFPISLHFSRLKTEKHSNFHLQSIVLTQFMKRYTKSHFTVSSETSLKGGGGQFLLNFFIFLS